MNADISRCTFYRYTLHRQFADGVGRCVFVMLNPSTADAVINDPTIVRCMGFAQSWGFKALTVVNLFAFRATDPVRLRAARDPIGCRNDEAIVNWCAVADKIVCAWGTKGKLLGRDKQVLELLKFNGFQLHFLQLTKELHPKHPLYVKGDTQSQKWRIAAWKSPEVLGY